jgi:hypothetical protein
MNLPLRNAVLRVTTRSGDYVKETRQHDVSTHWFGHSNFTIGPLLVVAARHWPVLEDIQVDA